MVPLVVFLVIVKEYVAVVAVGVTVSPVSAFQATMVVSPVNSTVTASHIVLWQIDLRLVVQSCVFHSSSFVVAQSLGVACG